jgi:hypothetical protein
MYWLIVLASAFNDGGDLHCVVALVGELLEEYYLLKVVLEAALSEQLVALKDQQLQSRLRWVVSSCWMMDCRFMHCSGIWRPCVSGVGPEERKAKLCMVNFSWLADISKRRLKG